MVKSGKRLLIVEDEFLIGFEIETILQSEGYDLVGPVGNITDALAAIADSATDDTKLIGAFLDANLNGKPVDQIAQALTRHAIPFVFLSGYGREKLPEGFKDVALIGKPFNKQDLVNAASAFLQPR